MIMLPNEGKLSGKHTDRQTPPVAQKSVSKLSGCLEI
jgi:hypothetical protein